MPPVQLENLILFQLLIRREVQIEAVACQVQVEALPASFGLRLSSEVVEVVYDVSFVKAGLRLMRIIPLLYYLLNVKKSSFHGELAQQPRDHAHVFVNFHGCVNGQHDVRDA